MSRDDHLARSWEVNAQRWVEAVRGGAIESRRDATDRAIVDLVLSLAPRSALDVGCGEGWLCRALASHSIRVVGIDGSERLVEAARALGGAEYHQLDYRTLESASPTVLSRTFDVVVFNFALLQDDHRALFRALRDRLAPGGVIVIQTLHPWMARGDNPYENGWRTENFMSLGTGWQPMPWYFRTLASWVDELRAAGCVVVDVQEPTRSGESMPISLIIVAGPEAEG
jgi:2-polyprenyl-3-methyl-5-hydroxy-6-metoxy-1,4-benzoquinol methylase